jgi:hypothetical protein
MGETPFNLHSPANLKNPVLTRNDVSDIKAKFVADPFVLRKDHVWYMFFEVFNEQTRKGEIGLAMSKDQVSWLYQKIVLAEPFHLSYPYVFEWMGEYFLIPETGQIGSLRLYRAKKFPTEWSFVKTLLDGGLFLDPSLFHFNQKWWLFAETNAEHKYDTLCLYYADSLLGPWYEHKTNPIVKGNPHIARPAGRILCYDDKIFRYAQDCYPEYGTKVQAFEITELTTDRYSEHPVDYNPILAATDMSWNKFGMHHIDLHRLDDSQWMACVDGWRWCLDLTENSCGDLQPGTYILEKAR